MWQIEFDNLFNLRLYNSDILCMLWEVDFYLWIVLDELIVIVFYLESILYMLFTVIYILIFLFLNY